MHRSWCRFSIAPPSPRAASSTNAGPTGSASRSVSSVSSPATALQLSARIAGAEHSLRLVAEKKPKDAETKQFVAAITERLRDLSAAVTAAENMPTSRRRAAHAAIAEQLDGIDADLMARLGLV